MRVLWLCNIILPNIAKSLSLKVLNGGGWLVGLSDDLAKANGIELAVCYPIYDKNIAHSGKFEKIYYYGFPKSRIKYVGYEDNMKNYMQKILDDFRPDIVHIFGTEMAHSLAMYELCQKKGVKTVISIQGLVSVIAQHYMAGLPNRVQNRFTFGDFIRQDNIKQQQEKLKKRGENEIKLLNKAEHIIGRTTWDFACTTQINPNINYHFCNETLRNEFYKKSWSLDSCEKFSLFISQGTYPIKGLHFMLEAMPIILRKFPKTKLYIAGPNIIKADTLKDKIKQSSYSKYIRELIVKYNLKRNIIFTGDLDEKKMCERYLKSHIFVCSSSIENSPNSLGEAMILGVPCVASNVGGIPDMLNNKDEGFIYQADAPYMLAYYIEKIFENENLVMSITRSAKKHALNTHDRHTNTKNLIEIYRNILSSKS